VRAPQVEEEWRSYVSLTDPANRQAFVRTLRSVIDLSGQAVSAHDRLYLASRLPTLIVWGRRDPIIPVEHATAAHAAVPESRLVIFEDSGHFPHAEEPQHFVEVLTDFLDTSEPLRLDEPAWRALLAAGPAA
jgi:pimeloyl-ACP methyl ester carboxylesterase